MRYHYNQWMNEEIKDYTPSGKIKRPSYSLIANWVKESWEDIDSDMIKRSFKCCGISNALDGKEDSLIFNFSKVQDVNNPNRGIEEDNSNESENSDEESGEKNSDEENNDSEDDNDSEDYYEENEDQNVVYDWN